MGTTDPRLHQNEGITFSAADDPAMQVRGSSGDEHSTGDQARVREDLHATLEPRRPDLCGYGRYSPLAIVRHERRAAAARTNQPVANGARNIW
jgi:hypothetical protein